MVREAEAQRASDTAIKEKVELKNRADQVAYQVDKQLKELGDKLPANTKAELETKVQAVRDAVKADDYDAMQRTLQELEQAAMAMGQAAYSDAAGGAEGGYTNGASGGSTSSGRNDDEDIVEGEYRDA
jgi:molecular chaperone DnaK